MANKIKNFITTLILSLGFVLPGLMGAGAGIAVAATQSGCGTGGVADQVAGGAGKAAGDQTIDCSQSSGLDASGSGIGDLAKNIVNIFSIVVGAAAIIMIMYGGFRYITSGGSSERVGNAKNTIIYAIVGLIIVGIAQLLVHFVLSKSANVGNNTTL